MPDKRSSDAGIDNKSHEHVAKKPRRSLDLAEAEITSRTAASDTALEVDIMILDYQAYRTTAALLKSGYNSYAEELISLQSNLNMVDAWFTIFKNRHPHYEDSQLCFRRDLLRFCTLYFRRLGQEPHTPSLAALQKLRDADNERAQTWIGQYDRIPTIIYPETCAGAYEQHLPTSMDDTRTYRELVLGKMEADTYHKPLRYGEPGSVSLLDLLPQFMQIFASVHAGYNSNLSVSAVQICTDYMRQACLEQYLAYNASGTDAIDQAFAWGCFVEQPERDTQDWTIDSMFRDHVTGQEVDLWKQSKRFVLDELMEDAGAKETVPERLARLVDAYPLEDLDASIRECMSAFLEEAIDLPILVQLEQGTLNGMTKEETTAFLQTLGLGSMFGG